MTQKTIKIIMNEIFSKPPEKKYATNKTDVYHIDDIWSWDILDLKDYGPENNRVFRYVSVITDNFSKFGSTPPLENKNTETKTNSFENILISPKIKSALFETDRGNEFYNILHQNFLNNNNIKHSS